MSVVTNSRRNAKFAPTTRCTLLRQDSALQLNGREDEFRRSQRTRFLISKLPYFATRKLVFYSEKHDRLAFLVRQKGVQFVRRERADCATYFCQDTTQDRLGTAPQLDSPHQSLMGGLLRSTYHIRNRFTAKILGHMRTDQGDPYWIRLGGRIL